jgi:hypothetical protein
MYTGLDVKCRYSCQILMKLEFSRRIFEKSWNIKFYENQSHGSRVVPCGQTVRQAGGRAGGRADGRTDGQTDVTKLIVAFRNFANTPENEYNNKTNKCTIVFYVRLVKCILQHVSSTLCGHLQVGINKNTITITKVSEPFQHWSIWLMHGIWTI